MCACTNLIYTVFMFGFYIYIHDLSNIKQLLSRLIRLEFLEMVIRCGSTLHFILFDLHSVLMLFIIVTKQ